MLAILWHCVHKAAIKFGTHEMDLPKLWWAANADNYGRIPIMRAYKSVILSEPKIEVRPASPGEMTENDAE